MIESASGLERMASGAVVLAPLFVACLNYPAFSTDCV